MSIHTRLGIELAHSVGIRAMVAAALCMLIFHGLNEAFIFRTILLVYCWYSSCVFAANDIDSMFASLTVCNVEISKPNEGTQGARVAEYAPIHSRLAHALRYADRFIRSWREHSLKGLDIRN